ncbi:hypothetical protein [Actinokineospora sp. NBRC 105648]|uniref:hypothetical protein n=1 Tax=Actinokineospora sp. NBRC 105648 TaxID=3032206 RepID=UPI0024A3A397|nr:hypothetical protein [Actinokineospora sp. NBRC 105648]GLZ37492.1 hypothetical protein Acsp05_11170 [Actinokineospora sp. NBRC 105648]
MTGLPGSGSLGPEERLLTARVHTVVTLQPDTVLVKVLAPHAAERYLRGEVSPGVAGMQPPFDFRLVGGTVARRQDCVQLRAPRDFHQAFRLDYAGSPFRPDQPVLHTMEFVAEHPDRYLVPYGAPSLPGLAPREPGYAMTAAALAAGVDPNSVRTEFAPWPFTGTGITAGGPLAVPEWWRSPAAVPVGARIMSNTAAGAHPVAIWRGRAWEELR